MNISKDVLIVGGGKLASAIAMLLTIKALTSYLSVEQYGELALALTFCNFVTQLIMGPLGQGVGRFYIEAERNKELGYFWVALKGLFLKAFIIIAVAYFTILASLEILSYDFGVGSILLGFALFFGFITGLNDIFCSMQNMALKRWISVRNNIFDIYLRLIFISVLALLFELTAIVALFAYILSGIIALIVNLSGRKDVGMVPNYAVNNWEREILRLAGNALAWGVFVWLFQVSDKWSIGVYSTAADVGKYAVIYQLSYVPVVMIFSVVNTIVAPLIFKSGRVGISGKSNFLLLSFLMILVGFLIYFYAGQTLLIMLSGVDYAGYGNLMPVLYLAAILYCIGDLFGINKLGEMKFGVVRRNKIIAALIGLLFNVLGANYFGASGVVYSILIYSILYFFLFFDVSYFRLMWRK